MKMSSNFIRVSLSAVLGTAFCALPSEAAAEQFSWRSLLGQTPATVSDSLSKMGHCQREKAHRFYIPVVSDTTDTRRDFIAPLTGNTLVDGDRPQEYPAITALSCQLSQAVAVKIHFWRSSAISVLIDYGNCSTRTGSIECIVSELSEQDYDRTLYDTMKKPDAYGIVSWDSPIPNPYFEKYSSLLADLELKRLLDKAGCAPGWLTKSDIKERCIIDATYEGGIFQSLSMIELIHNGWVTEDVVGRYASTQLYVEVETERAALDEFIHAVGQELSLRKATQQAAKRAKISKEAETDAILGTRN